MGLENLVKQVNKKLGKNIMVKGNEAVEIPRFSWGSLSLDAETGGGIPVGKIIGVIGEFSDGKTAIVLKAVAEFQKKYPNKMVVWIDAEGSWDRNWANTLGVQVDNVILVRPEYAQQAFDIALLALEDVETGLIVFDSMAAMTPKEEAEDDMEKLQVALQARLNKKFMRKAQTTMLDTTTEVPPTIIYINQLTTNIGGYGNPLIEAGGQALKYYPSLKIRLKRGDLYPSSKSIKDEGVEPKAQEIKFFVEKNKTAPPHRRGHLWFYFDTLDEHRPKGCYDNLEEIIRYALKYDIVKQRSSAFDLPDPQTGELITFKGSAKLATYIRDNTNVKEWITEQVMRLVQQEEEVEQDAHEHESEAGSAAVPEEQPEMAGGILDSAELDTTLIG